MRRRTRAGGRLWSALRRKSLFGVMVWAWCILGVMSLGGTASAQDEVVEEKTGETDEERRKRIGRLGSGKINYPAPEGEVMNIDQLLQKALVSNPEIRARKSSELFAELREKEANWGWFPTVEFNSALSAVPNNTDFNEVSSNIEKYLNFDFGPLTRNSVRLVFPVYTFGKISTYKDLAGIGRKEERLKTRKKRLEIVRKTREAYYSYQLGKLLMAFSADGRMLLKEEIEKINEDREFGDSEVDVADLRKLQIQDTDFDTKAVDNERLIRLTREGLAILVQLDPKTFDVPRFDENVSEDDLPTLEECLRLTREVNPDLKRLDNGVMARKRQVDVEVNKFFPDIFFAVDYNQSFSTVDDPIQTGLTKCSGDGNLGLGVLVPECEPKPFELEPLFAPFNFNRFAFAFGMRLRLNPVQQYWKMEQAEARLEETKVLRHAALQGMDLKIEKAWVEARDNYRKVEILERRLKASERWRNHIGIAYQAGGAGLQDFLKPLQAYFDARIKLLQAKYDYKIALARLAEQVGVIHLKDSVGRMERGEKVAPDSHSTDKKDAQ